MQDFVYDWMKNLAVYYLLLCTVMHLSPNEKYTRYLRYFMGLFLISMVSVPLLSLTNQGSNLSGNFQKYLLEAQEQQEELWQQFLEKEKNITEGLENIYGIMENENSYRLEGAGNQTMAGDFSAWNSPDGDRPSN